MRFSACLAAARPTPPLKSAAIRIGLALAALAALSLVAAPTGFTGQMLKMVAALAGACALAVFGLRALAPRQQRLPEAELRVVCRAALSPKNQLAIVEADGRRYLLAYGDAFVQLLDAEHHHEQPVHISCPEELQ